MDRSESIMKLTEALSKAQGMMGAAIKDSNNPFFHASYADLASCWDACRKPLSDNGLAIIQRPEIVDGKLRLSTILAHSSGEWISGEYPIEPMRQVKEKGWEPSGDPQSMGSAVTYARRYSLSAMVGIASEDDDGNAATGKKDEKGTTPKPTNVKKEEVITEPKKNVEELYKGSEILFVKLHDRMVQIENKFELQNWWKKPEHQTEIISLLPEHRKELEDLKNNLKKKFEEEK